MYIHCVYPATALSNVKMKEIEGKRSENINLKYFLK